MAQEKHQSHRKRPAAPPTNLVDEDNFKTPSPTSHQQAVQDTSSRGTGKLPLVVASVVSVVILSAVLVVSNTSQNAQQAPAGASLAGVADPAVPSQVVTDAQDIALASHITDALMPVAQESVVRVTQEKAVGKAWEASPLIEPKWEPSPLVKAD